MPQNGGSLLLQLHAIYAVHLHMRRKERSVKSRLCVYSHSIGFFSFTLTERAENWQRMSHIGAVSFGRKS